MAQISINPFTGSGLTRGKNPLFNYTTGKQSRFLIAESADYQNETFVPSSYYAIQPELLSSNLGPTADTIDQDWIDGTNASNFKELGIETPGGDSTFHVTGDGTSLFTAGITNATSLTATNIGTQGDTTLKAQGVVGSNSGDTFPITPLTAIPSAAGDPGRRITVTFDSTLIPGNLRNKVGEIHFAGEDAAGNTINDSIAVDQTATAIKVYTTKKFFRGPVTAFSRGLNGTVTAAITATNSAQRVTGRPDDGALQRWYGIYQQVGNVPNAMYGGVMNSMTLSLTQGSTVTMGINWTGKRYVPHRNLDGSQTNVNINGIPATYAQEDVLPYWAGELILDGVPMPLVDATCTINRNLAYSNVIAGVQHQAFPPYDPVKRTVEISGNILYSSNLDLQTKWKDRDSISAVFAVSFGTTRTGKTRKGSFDYQYCIVIPASQLSVAPNPEISAREEQTMPFSLMAIRQHNSTIDYSIEAQHANYTAPITATRP